MGRMTMECVRMFANVVKYVEIICNVGMLWNVSDSGGMYWIDLKYVGMSKCCKIWRIMLEHAGKWWNVVECGE